MRWYDLIQNLKEIVILRFLHIRKAFLKFQLTFNERPVEYSLSKRIEDLRHFALIQLLSRWLHGWTYPLECI